MSDRPVSKAGVTKGTPDAFLLKIIIGSALVTVLALGILAFRYPTSQIPAHVFAFRFNWYALLSIVGILFNAFLLVYVNRPKLKAPEATWFSLYLMMNLIWGIGEAATRLSATPNGAVFWWVFESVGLGFAPVAFFLFALAYTYQDNFVRYVRPVLIMITLGLLMTYLFIATGVLVDKNPAHVLVTAWGYYPTYPNSYAPFLIWLLACYAGSQGLLMSRFRHTRDWPKVKLFIFGALVPLIIGMVTDAILPAFGAFFPPSAVVATAIFAAIVAYVMGRYGLLRLNPRTFAPGLLQTMSESVIVTDPQFRIEYFNVGAASLLSVENGQQIEAKDLRILFSAEQEEALQKQVIKPLLHHEVGFYDDALIRSLNGPEIPVSISATKVLDSQSRLTGYSFVLTDLRQIKAAEKQLEEEKHSVERKVEQRTLELSQARAQLEASIRSLPFGFAIITPDNEITFANDQLRTLLDRDIPSGAASKAVLTQINDHYKSAIDLLACLREAQTTEKPLEKNISFGAQFFRFFFTPILSKQDGQVIGSVLIMEDTTEANALERSRDEFFSIVSHELRTPLTAIRGNSDMVLQLYDKQLKDPDLRQMVKDIHEASLRLITIVNEFLDISRLEQAKTEFKITKFDVGDLVKHIVHEFDIVNTNKKLSIKLAPVSGTVMASADMDRTKQVLVSLIGNAIKFTSHGSISVHVQSLKNHVKIAIQDTGSGIPIESQHLLFRKLQQATSSILTRDNTQSAGLGLYTAKLITEGMGGKIYLEKSEVGKGSIFMIELPTGDK